MSFAQVQNSSRAAQRTLHTHLSPRLAARRTPITCTSLSSLNRSAKSCSYDARLPQPLAASRIARASTKISSAAGTADPLVAVEGDIVTIHFACKDLEGNVIESTKKADEPLTFELGASSVMQNPLIEAFDSAVRGLGVGDTTTLEAQGGDWNRELLFKVPVDHPEVVRLQGRYKNQGGLKTGLLVELANGGMAVVLEVTEEYAVLDANNMMAGKTLEFDLEVVAIERGS